MKTMNKRLPVLDLAKSLSIIFMIFVHVLEVSTLNEDFTFNSPVQYFLASLIEFFGGIPSAGIFIFTMGFLVGWIESKNSKQLIKEAGKLFILGIVVNVFEQWLPVLLEENAFQDFKEVLPAIFATDIYFFDAMTILCLAAIFLLKKENRVIAASVIILVTFILSIVLNGVVQSTGNVWLDDAAGLFVKLNEYSYFPLLNWIIFPLLGFVIGSIFKKKQVAGEKYTKTYRIISIFAGIILILVSYFFMKFNEIPDLVCFGSPFPDENYYNMNGLSTLEGIGIIVLLMNLYEGICYLTKGNIPKILSYMSTNIMDIYMFQWLLIGLFTYFLEENGNVYLNMLAALFILVMSVVLTACKKRLIGAIRRS